MTELREALSEAESALAIPGVYAVTHTGIGQQYIGQSVNVAGRWREHKAALDLNRHNNVTLQRLWEDEGESAFTIEILEALPDAWDDNPFHRFKRLDREKFYLDRRYATCGSHEFNRQQYEGRHGPRKEG